MYVCMYVCMCNGHLPRQPGSAGTRMSPFWILLRWWVMTTGAIRRAQLQSNRHHQTMTTLDEFTELLHFSKSLPLIAWYKSCSFHSRGWCYNGCQKTVWASDHPNMCTGVPNCGTPPPDARKVTQNSDSRVKLHKYSREFNKTKV